jgi:hypothetical protein
MYIQKPQLAQGIRMACVAAGTLAGAAVTAIFIESLLEKNNQHPACRGATPSLSCAMIPLSLFLVGAPLLTAGSLFMSVIGNRIANRILGKT